MNVFLNETNRNSRLIAVIAVVAVMGASCVSQRVDSPVGSPDLLNDASALESFVDGIVTNSMQQIHVPGAVVTIVKDDRVIFNKGYGFANLEQRTPVDPDKTLFRIASVSKVINAMTVMRLVDEGLLDVNEDVRPRLAAAGLELDHEEYGPLTLKALLTHTGGIRDLSIPNVTSTTNAGQELRLGSYLQKCLPLRWQEPGESVLYTDHGITLAGYVAELASNTRFPEVVRQRVLQPLAMNHTWYSVPEEQQTNLAMGYNYEKTDCQPMPRRYPNHEPAIGLHTTGSDMARLMICHLSGCKDFLDPGTTKLMHEPQCSDDARLGLQWTCGLAYQTEPIGNPRWSPYLYHIGGAYGFISVLGISRELGLGVFVAQNRMGPRVFDLAVLLPAPGKTKIETAKAPPTSIKPVSSGAAIKSLAGTYVSNRTLSHGNKLAREDYVYVRYVEEINGLELKYWDTRENPSRYIQVTPMLFQAVKADERFPDTVRSVSFRTSNDGERTYLIDHSVRGDGAFRRISLSDRAIEAEGKL